MEEKETMIQIDNVSKVYRLGEIGGTTLKETIQRLGAKIRHKEDPTKKIGAKNYNKGEKFKALDNINLTIKKGERVGIIGHNGAGKSTLLKLICRVTAPTTGEIGLNGRVTSMLEVGTGFHPELTGRENIYMNGAILGMTKKEIDAVIEDIIDFSEVREFIDTPVKRYSSGMYVKLAFSVAAHLKSEIMIMDEVLAVGDMAFQNKCLNKMKSVSEEEGRTILYVSHNMNTIQKLCDRVIVLNQGSIVYDGGTNTGIAIYLGSDYRQNKVYNFTNLKRDSNITSNHVIIKQLEILNEHTYMDQGSKLRFSLDIDVIIPINDLRFRFIVCRGDTTPIGTCFSNKTNYLEKGLIKKTFEINTSFLSPDDYYLHIVAYQEKEVGVHRADNIESTAFFTINQHKNKNIKWNAHSWGNICIEKAKEID